MIFVSLKQAVQYTKLGEKNKGTHEPTYMKRGSTKTIDDLVPNLPITAIWSQVCFVRIAYVASRNKLHHLGAPQTHSSSNRPCLKPRRDNEKKCRGEAVAQNAVDDIDMFPRTIRIIIVVV